MSSWLKKVVKKAVKEQLAEIHTKETKDSKDKKEPQPKPKQKAIKCSNCKGKGYISEWKSEAYTGYGKYRSSCCKCLGKQYVVVMTFKYLFLFLFFSIVKTMSKKRKLENGGELKTQTELNSLNLLWEHLQNDKRNGFRKSIVESWITEKQQKLTELLHDGLHPDLVFTDKILYRLSSHAPCLTHAILNIVETKNYKITFHENSQETKTTDRDFSDCCSIDPSIYRRILQFIPDHILNNSFPFNDHEDMCNLMTYMFDQVFHASDENSIENLEELVKHAQPNVSGTRIYDDRIPLFGFGTRMKHSALQYFEDILGYSMKYIQLSEFHRFNTLHELLKFREKQVIEYRIQFPVLLRSAIVVPIPLYRIVEEYVMVR